MKPTVLDHLCATAHANKHMFPVLNGLLEAVLEIKPPAMLWPQFKPDALACMPALPATGITWPDGAFCVQLGTAGVPHHNTAIAIDADNPIVSWMKHAATALTGIMVFSPGPDTFDVIGLVELGHTSLIFPEAQIHFVREEAGWRFEYAQTGSTNGMFYDAVVPVDAVELPPIDRLGSLYLTILGGLYHHINQPGKWVGAAAVGAKVKNKNGKINKVIRTPLLGHKTFIPENHK